jgi:hypothetical protein
LEKSTLAFSLATGLAASALATLVSCGASSGGSTFVPGGADATADGTGGPFGDGGGGGEGGLIGSGDGGMHAEGGGSVISSAHIVPANATITVQAGQTATQAYTVMGIVDGASTETDVTSRFVFWVPDN